MPHMKHGREATAHELEAFARELGLTVESLHAIRVCRIDGVAELRAMGAGFREGSVPPWAWGFPEFDADRQVVGLGLRAPDGRKGFRKGGKRGLVIPRHLPADGPEVFVVEGPSDTAALLSLGLPVVGRCSNNGGAELLTDALSGFERVVVLGEYDPKPDGRWPGWEGAEAVAGKLARAWNRSVFFAMPPHGTKDVRAWLKVRREAEPTADLLELGQSLRRQILQDSNEAVPEGLRVIPMSEVEGKPVEWFWRGWLPKGKLVLVAGDAGVGKSMLLADLAARMSQGGEVPGGGERFDPSEVLLFAAEDDPADTLKPRLEAARAACDRVHVVPHVDRGKDETMFDLTQHLPLLLTELKARPAVRVVVIDPVLSFTGDARTNDHGEVRRLTNELTRLAAECGVTVLAVTHFNKNEDGAVLNRVLGAGAWVQASRMAWIVGEHPEDEEARVLLPFKSNLGHRPAGLVFRIEGEEVGRIRWSEERFEGEPEDLVRRGFQRTGGRTRVDEAELWLGSYLAVEPRAASEVYAEAEAAGFSKRTIERAAPKLGVKKTGGPGSLWCLPSPEPVSPGAMPPVPLTEGDDGVQWFGARST